MTAYYNENDPHAAEWLRNLIKAGEIAHGEVDTRSIEDVTPNDLRGFVQCHFFAGIGGWSRALRLAGWPDSRPAWTGSCPCQPFSAAGKGLGTTDQRHLWPAWMHLIRQCRPAEIYGEQVASAIRHGWLDTVFDDLQNSGYAVGAANLPAASVGAPHLRERVWFVGSMADGEGARGRANFGAIPGGAHQRIRDAQGQDERRASERSGRTSDSRAVDGLVDANQQRDDGRWIGRPGWRVEPANSCDDDWPAGWQWPGAELGNASRAGLEGRKDFPGNDRAKFATIERASDDAGTTGHADGGQSESGQQRIFAGSDWSVCEWLSCIDGNARPTQPGLSPLAYGIPRNMGAVRNELAKLGLGSRDVKRLAKRAGRILLEARAFRMQQIRGYGNAIVPQLAAEFIRATMTDPATTATNPTICV